MQSETSLVLERRVLRSTSVKFRSERFQHSRLQLVVVQNTELCTAEQILALQLYDRTAATFICHVLQGGYVQVEVES